MKTRKVFCLLQNESVDNGLCCSDKTAMIQRNKYSMQSQIWVFMSTAIQLARHALRIARLILRRPFSLHSLAIRFQATEFGAI